MKKAYSKPEILFEDFSLSVNIAGNCSPIAGSPTEGECSIIGSGGEPVFTGDIAGCMFKPEDMGYGSDEWDEICYNVPFDYANYFNS